MLKHISGEKGSAIVELALTTPLLLLLLVASAELGRIAYAAIEVANAARAGAAYGSINHENAQKTGNITQAAENEAANITDLSTPTVTEYCVCQTTNNSTGHVTTTSQESCATADSAYLAGNFCDTSTTNGVTNTMVEYVDVSTQATVNTMFHYPGIPSSFTLNGFSEMRVVGD